VRKVEEKGQKVRLFLAGPGTFFLLLSSCFPCHGVFFPYVDPHFFLMTGSRRKKDSFFLPGGRKKVSFFLLCNSHKESSVDLHRDRKHYRKRRQSVLFTP